MGSVEGYPIATLYQPWNLRWTGRYLHLQFDVGTSGHSGANLISTSTALSATNSDWEHIAVSYRDDTKEAKFYVNGILDSTRTFTSEVVKEENIDSLFLGHYSGGFNAADAELADVRIFEHSNQHCLDQDAVTALYNGGSNPATNGGNVYVADQVGDVPGALGWWKLNENSIGRAYDFSGNMNHGVNWFIENTVGTYAAEFNGTTSYVDTGNVFKDFAEAEDRSLSVWVYNGGNTQEARIFNTGLEGSNTAFALGVDAGTNNKPFYFLRTAAGAAIKEEFGDVMSTSTWYHFAIVCDGSANNAKLYQNGVLKAIVHNTSSSPHDADVGEPAVTATATANIGAHFNISNGNYFNGKIADVRIYESVLTDGGVSVGQTATGNIATLYSSGTNPSTAGVYPVISGTEPVGWWKLGEEFTAIDSTSNNRHGIARSGGNPSRIRVMSEKSQAAPTNSIDAEAAFTVTADHTTFENLTGSNGVFYSSTVNINNCTLLTSPIDLRPTTITALKHCTIDGYRRGFWPTANCLSTAVNNLTITNSTSDDIRSSVICEISDCTFDVAETFLDAGSILSKNHTNTGSATVANDCQMLLPGKYNIQNFTDTLSDQNVTVYKHASYSPNLALNSGGSPRTFNDLTIPTGSLVTHEQDFILTVTLETDITGDYFVGTGGDAPTAAAKLITGKVAINSGGEFRAPTTTQITSETSDKSWENKTGGEFVHNDGLIYITNAASYNIDNTGVGNFYDLTTAAGGGGYDITLVSDVIVENNFTHGVGGIAGTLRANNQDLTVHGTFELDDSANAKFYGGSGAQNFNNVKLGNGCVFSTSSAVNVNSFRNFGGTVT